MSKNLDRSSRGGVAATNYVLHIPRQFTTPKAGIFTFCGRRVADVNCVGTPHEYDNNTTDAICRVCRKRKL